MSNYISKESSNNSVLLKLSLGVKYCIKLQYFFKKCLQCACYLILKAMVPSERIDPSGPLALISSM